MLEDRIGYTGKERKVNEGKEAREYVFHRINFSRSRTTSAGRCAASRDLMQLISRTVTLRDLPHSLAVMVAQRLPVHPQQLAKVPARAPFDRSLTAELIAGSEDVDLDAARSG